MTADELLGRYYALAYNRSGGNYKEAGRRLGVDWRVVKTGSIEPSSTNSAGR